MGNFQHSSGVTNREDFKYLAVDGDDFARGHLRHVSQTPLLVNEEEEEEEEEKKRDGPGVKQVMLEMDKEPQYPDEVWKTLLTFLWLLSGMVTTTVALIVTNERHEYSGAPLPDLVLDNIEFQPWGVSVSEMIMVVAILTAFLTTLMHTHRIIILRRVFFIIGLMYFYRAVTMSVTVLPKPDPNWTCPKQNTSLTASNIFHKLKGVATQGGISLGEKQQFCGDYIFSGHTMCLILSYLVVKQYSPPQFCLLHWVSYFMFLAGVGSLLSGRGHYTVDVILGYWILTRVWSIYHGLADRHKKGGSLETERHLREGVWWGRFFDFLEGNVPGPLPARYSLPLPSFLTSRLPSLCGSKRVGSQERRTETV